MKHKCWHATQATITFNLFPLSIYFLSLYVDWLKSHLSGLITANNVWYLSVWLWHWPNAAFVVSKLHAIIKKMYPPAHILTRYRTYSTFLRTYKSASFITIIAFVFVVGASCCFVSAMTGYPMPRCFFSFKLAFIKCMLHCHLTFTFLMHQSISSLMFLFS